MPHTFFASQLHYFNDSHSIFNILDHISDGCTFIDNNWRVLFWNQAAERITGFSKEEVINKILWDEFPEAKDGPFNYHYNKAKKLNTATEFETFYPPMNIWLEVKAHPVPEGLAVYFKDISQRKRLQEEIAYQKKQQECLINASNDTFYSVDREFRLLAANKTFLYHTYKYSGKEVKVGDVITDLMSVEEGNKWKPFYEKVFAGEKIQHELLVEYPVTGESVYTQIDFNPIIDDDTNEIVGVACYARDITANKKYIKLIENKNNKLQEQEKALQHTTEKLQTLLQHSPDIIATVDKDGNYVSVNEAAETLLGYTPAEVEGKHFSLFVYPDDLDKTADVTVKIIDGKKVTAFRNRLVKKNGEIIPLMWSAVWNKTEDLMFCVAKDATALYEAEITRKQAEQKLNEMVAWLTKQNEILRKIAYIQSHELRKPVANILGLAELILDADQTAETNRSSIELLKASTKELDEMIRNIVAESFSISEAAREIKEQAHVL